MKKFISVFLFCLLPFTSYSGELLQHRENYLSEFAENCNEIELADIAWKKGSLEIAWSIYSSVSEIAKHPLFQSGICLRKVLLAHEMGMNEEAKENTLAFIKPFITESEMELDMEDLELITESAMNAILRDAKKFKELFFSFYEDDQG